MSAPVRFLMALTQSLSTMGLYGDDHPATLRALDNIMERLRDLQEGPSPKLHFTFLAGEVLFNSEPVPELENWEWSGRFVKAGIERIEFTEMAEPEQFARFLAHLTIRLGIRSGSTTDDLWQMGDSAIRFGQIALAEGFTRRLESPLAVATLTYTLREERETIDWMHQEIRDGSKLPMVEAEAVVRSLSLAMHSEQAMVLPLLQLKEFDQYTTTHSMNVSVLAMALGEFLQLGPATVRALGVAGLLHDLGKVCIPRDILVKPGTLTDSEREVIQQHPVTGAKMLLEHSEPMELAAVVAYEHHVRLDGGGYPKLHDARGAQYASRIVHICDVYDALRTTRPYRHAWESERALTYIHDRAGVEFDPSIAGSFISMMRKWDSQVALQSA
ncbi:MAG TPA: HD domain-containing phosphohydrolase [Gemmatimonadales bacterium]|jgi:putative nucleotidyltransferase with HDIG domain|nr:HD domain-containing phosphohydrolase [Gemmatimonadales bacterium]